MAVQELLFSMALAHGGLDLLFLGKSQLGSGRGPPVGKGFLAAVVLSMMVFCHKALTISTRVTCPHPAMNFFPHLLSFGLVLAS